MICTNSLALMSQEPAISRSNSTRSSKSDPGRKSFDRKRRIGSGSHGSTGDPELFFPLGVLNARFKEWQRVIKAIMTYIDSIIALEHQQAKDLTKVWVELQKALPFADSNQFVSADSVSPPGIQTVISELRTKTTSVATHHSNLAQSLGISLVNPLKSLHGEIKELLRTVSNLPKLQEVTLREREISIAAVTDLNVRIVKAKGAGVEEEEGEWTRPPTVNDDPWIAKLKTGQQLRKQVEKENELATTTQKYLDSSRELERKILSTIQETLQSFTAMKASSLSDMTTDLLQLNTLVTSFSPRTEWNHFLSLPYISPVLPRPSPPPSITSGERHFVRPDTQGAFLPLYRDPLKLTFPGKEDLITQPIRTGVLERKRRVTRAWKKNVYVLTPAGWLHEFDVSVDLTGLEKGLEGKNGSIDPVQSLFLPACLLGHHSPSGAKEHTWLIQGKRNSALRARTSIRGASSDGGVEGNGAGVAPQPDAAKESGEKNWRFRATSWGEMMSWWEAMQPMARVHLIAKYPSPSGSPRSPQSPVTPAATPVAVQELLEYRTDEVFSDPDDEDEEYGIISGAEGSGEEDVIRERGGGSGRSLDDERDRDVERVDMANGSDAVEEVDEVNERVVEAAGSEEVDQNPWKRQRGSSSNSFTVEGRPEYAPPIPEKDVASPPRGRRNLRLPDPQSPVSPAGSSKAAPVDLESPSSATSTSTRPDTDGGKGKGLAVNGKPAPPYNQVKFSEVFYGANNDPCIGETLATADEEKRRLQKSRMGS